MNFKPGAQTWLDIYQKREMFYILITSSTIRLYMKEPTFGGGGPVRNLLDMDEI